MTNPYLGPLPPAPKPWSPTGMVTAQGPQRGAQMERMARPSGVRKAFKKARTTGILPGAAPSSSPGSTSKPPSSSQY